VAEKLAAPGVSVVAGSGKDSWMGTVAPGGWRNEDASRDLSVTPEN
jgi:hypothetical protein